MRERLEELGRPVVERRDLDLSGNAITVGLRCEALSSLFN